MEKGNIIIASLLGLSIVAYVVLSIYNKDLQAIQSVVSLLVGLFTGYNRNSISTASRAGMKMIGFTKTK